MPAAPKKVTQLDRKPPKLVTLFGPADGSAPVESGEVDWLHPSRIERAIGGSRVTNVTFKYDLGKTREKIVDTLAPKGVTRQIEIRELDDAGQVSRVLMWGKLAAQPIELVEETQSVSYVVRVDKHLMGGPLIRTPFWSPRTSTVEDLDRPFIFNLEIDDLIRANKSNYTDPARGDLSLFYDVAGPNTAAARATHSMQFTKWRIFEAAHCLCWLLNAEEKFVKNPTLAELEAAIGDVDKTTAKLKNLKLTPGKHLSELLDELLLPFGCSWYIAFDHDADNGTTRRLKCIRRNEGPQMQLWLQRSAAEDSDSPAQLDPSLSFLTKLNLNYDITNLANRIVGSSSRMQREVTLELKKCWPVSEDSLDRENLMKLAQAKKDHPHAGHMFVGNESGAYNGLRPEITTHLDLSTYFGKTVPPIARKVLPCLSRVQDNNSDKLESRGITVEWWDPDDTSWKPVTWSFSVLQQEIGIWFEQIPQELWDILQDDPDNLRIRVTGTIEGDHRLQAIAERRDSSPNADDVTLYLDLDDKFHDRDVHSSSIYYSDLTTADTAYDQGALQTYVDRVRDIEDAAELSCSAELEGIDHPEYELGDLITRVNGVNISLIRDNPAVGVAGKALQIVGITLDVQTQRTELLLETFDEEKLT